jgi:DNA (cytosine-5)-methyltransferase 1
MAAYYNEFEPYAAEWLRNLIKKGLIADGEVDSRSILDVGPDDIRGFTQCHFFAGIGVWSHALRLAGWPDDEPVWTGSCPCQPFSAAGKGKGIEDERHLWPEFHRLISECRPPVVFGEQVASKDGLGWLDAVFSDLEGSGYAAGAVDLCAAGVGAPHIRQRLWFVGERLADTSVNAGGAGLRNRGAERERYQLADGLRAGGLGHDDNTRLEGQRSGHQAEAGRLGAVRPVAQAGEPRGLADAVPAGRPEGWAGARNGQVAGDGSDGRPRPTNGHWRDADWLHCRDGKWRPVEPGTFPLAHGAPSRVGRLRAYGNAIVPQVAAKIIGAYMSMSMEEAGWARVVFSADCDEDGNCPVCSIDYADCSCPGPTQEDEFEYMEDSDGSLWARRRSPDNAKALGEDA